MDKLAGSNNRASNDRASTSEGGPEPSSTDRTWYGRRKDSEWVFRPLRLKFKVKQLEELYKNAVYRQQQSLLIFSCVIMMTVSLLALVSFLASGSVRTTHPPTHTHTHMYHPHTHITTHTTHTCVIVYNSVII